MRRLAAVSAWVVLAACAHAPQSNQLEGTEYISATIWVPTAGPVEVELTLPRGFLPPGPTTLEASFRNLPERYAQQLVTEVVDGRAVPFRASRPVPAEGDVVLRYQVRLPERDAAADALLLDGSFQTKVGRHLALRYFLPLLSVPRGQPLRRPGAVRLVVPSGFKVAASMAQEGDRLVHNDYAEFTNGVVEVGEFSEVTSALGTRFVSPDFGPAQLARFAHVEELAEPRLKARLGSRQRLRLVTVFQLPNPTQGTWLAGLRVGEAVLVRWERPPATFALAPEMLIFLHELTHVHLPRAEDLPMWVGEGVTDYLAASTALEVDGASEGRERSMIQKAWLRLSYSSRELKAGGTGTVPYTAGAVLGYCVDVRLRKDGSSLAQVLARANVRAGGRSINNGFWEEEIALASSAAGAYVLRARNEPLDDPKACFDEAGLVTAPARSASAPLPVNLKVPWYALAVDGTYFGLEVDSRRSIFDRMGPLGAKLKAGLSLEPFAEGDLIWSLDGQSIDTLADLERAVEAVPGGASAKVVVLRGGELVTLELTPSKSQAP